jgi:hypothetical protein
MDMNIKSIHIFLLCTVSYSTHAQWQPCAGTAGLNMQSLLSNDTYNFAGGQTGTYLSTDNASTYVLSNSGNDDVGPTRGFTKDIYYVYTCTSQGAFRSSDNGSTWISKSAGLTNLLGSGILKVGSKLFYVGTTGVYISSDQGENWTSAGLSTTDVRSIAAINDTLYVGTNGSGIYKSIDLGANWVTVNNGLNGASNFRAMESKGNTLFAGGPVGTGVFRSTDFGANWILLSGGITSGSYRGFASNSQLIIAGSFGGGVFYSEDNGDNWTIINTGLTDLSIFDLELNDSFIIAATKTQGVFRFELSNLTSSAGISSSLKQKNISLFPNPATNQINLSTDLGSLGSVYTLIDNLGRSVLSGEINSATTIIELQSILSGIYYLTLDGNDNPIFKVIKQ